MNGNDTRATRGAAWRNDGAFAAASARSIPPDVQPLVPVPELILFDLDDTLCDYAAARACRLRIAFRTALAHAPGGAEIDLDRMIAESIALHPHGSDHFAELLTRYGLTDAAAIQAAREWYHANRFHGLSLFEDAVATLQSVRAALPGRRIGLITNGPADVQRDKIALLDLARHVDFAIISGEFGVAKPDPAIFEEGLRRGRATRNAALYIGDSPEYDVAGARAAGIRVIWMNRAGLPWPGSPPPPEGVRSLAEVRALLGAPARTPSVRR
jgi:HAD superfamily hydrolase (TIGR01549 family)